MKPVVLYVLDYYLPHRWGVETVFEQIISRTIASGKKVIILTSHFDPKLPTYEKHDDLKIYRVGKWRIWFMFQALFKWAQILKNQQIDLIHTSTYWWAIPASLLAKLFGKKVLITVHEIFAQLWHQYKGWWKWWIYRIFEWLIFQLPFDAFHCVSLYTFNSLRLVYGIQWSGSFFSRSKSSKNRRKKSDFWTFSSSMILESPLFRSYRNF